MKRKDKFAKFKAERLIRQAVRLAFANDKSFDRKVCFCVEKVPNKTGGCRGNPHTIAIHRQSKSGLVQGQPAPNLDEPLCFNAPAR
jgi:hypothetical protein